MMKKWIMIIAAVMELSLLIACGNSNSKDMSEKSDKSSNPLVEESSKIDEKSKIPLNINLNSETGIKEYLIGEWFCEMEYMTNMVANLKVEEDLDIQLSFYDSQTEEVGVMYEGYLALDWLYATLEEPPDLIRLILKDEEYSEGDYFYLHRTVYDEKQIMSLFFAGNGNSVFGQLTEHNESSDMVEELIFDKVAGENIQEEPRKNDAFYAVFWGHGKKNESIWLDDVLWTPLEDGEYETLYPPSMTLYQNDEYISILYEVEKRNTFEILGDDLFKGTVYYVETDLNGSIVTLIDADYQKYLEGGYTDQSNYRPETERNAVIFDIITTEVQEIQFYLDEGMSILYSDETVLIGDETCYQIVLGTDQEEQFVRELYFAVDIVNREVYQLDVLNDVWEPLAVG